MEKIVNKPLKVDLHVHSCHSKHRETDNLTSNCTIENLGILVNNLKEKNVDVVAITDHDVFSYDMYEALKKKETDGTFKKVFPGVEFSVYIKNDEGKDWPVHVIAIFDDSDEAKVKNIENVLGDGIKKEPNYNCGDRFDETRLIELLDEIGLDAVFIAHQKQTITSKSKPKANDMSGVGEEQFNKYLFSEFFQALEFHDKRNELFNIKSQNEFSEELLRFITGSDCHDWEVYPNHDSTITDSSSFKHTYLKCLPTFRGLALALTDASRISLTPSFFSVSDKYISQIDLTINEKHFSIPLSRGINAIIGDNSIGKSLILHKITNYYRETDHVDTSIFNITRNLKTKYENYLDRKGINITTRVNKQNIYEFDTQGEIRRKITDNKLTDLDFIKKRAPENPNIKIANEKVKSCVREYIKYLKSLSTVEGVKNSLEESKLKICPEEFEATVLKVSNMDLSNFIQSKTEKTTNKSKIDAAIKALKDILDLANETEQKEINNAISLLEEMQKRYVLMERLAQNVISVVSIINNVFTGYNDNQTEITDDDKEISLYSNKKDSFVSSIIKYIENKEKISEFHLPSIETTVVPTERIEYDEYKIVNCSNIGIVDNNYLLSVFSEPLKKDMFKRETFIDNSSLRNALFRYNDSDSAAWDYYEKKIMEKIDLDLSSNCKINMLGDDDREDKSQGFGQKMYFKVICSDVRNEGVYLIDQPEDDVSQKSIKTELIKNLRKMSRTRQILLITHNPQFVVNLDVDNVIYLYEDDQKQVSIQSGALEYKNEETKEDILTNVAETLDGGVMTIRKRWKRYEKNIDDIVG